MWTSSSPSNRARPGLSGTSPGCGPSWNPSSAVRSTWSKRRPCAIPTGGGRSWRISKSYMLPDRDKVHLWDMLNAAQGVVSSLQGLTFAKYAADENLRLATERRIEIIGEAARRISSELKDAHPEIPWRLIVDQRNVLIH